MGKSFLKGLSTLLVVLVFLSMIGGCGKSGQKTDEKEVTTQKATETATVAETKTLETQKKEKVKFTVFHTQPALVPNSKPWGEDPVSRRVEEKTGVQLEVMRPMPGDDIVQKLNMLIAVNEIPDCIAGLRIGTGNIYQKLLDGKYIMPLDDLLKSNGTNIINFVPQQLWNFVKNEDDGKTYYIPDVFDRSYDKNYPGYSMMVRQDYYEILGSPKTETLDDYINMLRMVKTQNLKSKSGKQVIPLEVVNGWNAYLLRMRTLFGVRGINGTGEGISDSDNPRLAVAGEDTYAGPLMLTFDHPGDIEAVKFVNKLYREGLLNTSFLTQKPEQSQELIANGQVFQADGYAYWERAIDQGQVAAVKVEGDKARFIGIAAPKPPNVKEAKMVSGTIGGTSGVYFSSKCNKPERLMDYWDYMASKEGLLVSHFGIEGEHWDYDENGNVQYRDYMLKMRREQGNDIAFETHGMYKWPRFDTTDYAYDQIQPKNNTPQLNSIFEQGRKLFYDGMPLNGIVFSTSSAEGKTEISMTQLYTRIMPKVLVAKSEAECVSLYNDLANQIRKIEGAQRYIDACNEQHRKLVKKLQGN